MSVIYYIEVNLLCMIIMLYIANQMRFQNNQFSENNRIINLISWATVIMCFSDMIAGICRGQFFWGARVIIEISNLIFFEAISVVSFLWLVYVLTKLKIIKNYKKELFLWSIPFIAISVLTLINPFTNFLFTIDKNNIYARNDGVYLHWIISWFYLVAATVLIVYKIIREKNKNKRREIVPLLYFIIFPALAAVIQMLFYGVTCNQVGITISIVIISLAEQNNKILTDALTGLSNRYGFNKYLVDYMQHHLGSRLFLVMVDINNFKKVNDQFSHMEGDRALADVADVLKQSCEESTDKLFVFRYGGDEFLIAGCDCRQDEIINLKSRIHKKVEEKNCSENYPYVLSVSIGTASGICLNSNDINHLLRAADDMMYQEKAKKE